MVIRDYINYDDGISRAIYNTTRDTGHVWAFRIGYPTSLTVSRDIYILDPTSTVAYFLITSSIQSDGTTSRATLVIRAYSAFPYSLQNSTAAITSSTSYVTASILGIDSDASCFDVSGNAVSGSCVQDIEILLTPGTDWDTLGGCQYDGNYTLSFNVNCRSANFNRTCPSPSSPLTSTPSLIVDTASACPRVDYNLPFTTSLASKKGSTVQSTFRFTDTITFEASLSWPALIGVSVSALTLSV